MDQGLKPGDRLGPASELLAHCVDGSLEVRAGAILDAHGGQLFATDDADWSGPVAELWRLAGSPERDVSYLHIGTEDGDVLAVRGAAGCAVVASDRFPLASLVLSDLRAVVREMGAA
jgi:hypothetical protein